MESCNIYSYFKSLFLGPLQTLKSYENFRVSMNAEPSFLCY